MQLNCSLANDVCGEDDGCPGKACAPFDCVQSSKAEWGFVCCCQWRCLAIAASSREHVGNNVGYVMHCGLCAALAVKYRGCGAACWCVPYTCFHAQSVLADDYGMSNLYLADPVAEAPVCMMPMLMTLSGPSVFFLETFDVCKPASRLLHVGLLVWFALRLEC